MGAEMSNDEHEEICKRREDAAWGNGLSWGVSVSGAVFLIATIIYMIWGK